MSDNVNEEKQQQQMEKIFICADIWHGVFAFLSPFDVGLKMALISDRLDVLVDVHFKSREWSLGSMEIRRAIGRNGAEIVSERSGGRPLPIPQEPLPGQVIGFEEIWISFVDQSVIEFLQRIRRLFNSSRTNVYIKNHDQSRSWEIIWQKIWPLVSHNICGLLRLNSPRLDHLRQFSPEILRNCANLRSIDSMGFFPAFPAEDAAGASSRQAMAKWLLTPRGDGLPKMLICEFDPARMGGLKRAFVNASEPVNFIIRPNFSGIGPFELTNYWTGERLTLRRLKNKWLLVRCPIAREEDKWAKWEEEAIEWQWRRQCSCITTDFKDRDIGDGILDENDEGPSEPKKPKK
ncbi:hypothetical protein GPALN_003280 [Globodera pallida]|nr:hypothetical protein GPALN_003280 [Globodera pallida]